MFAIQNKCDLINHGYCTDRNSNFDNYCQPDLGYQVAKASPIPKDSTHLFHVGGENVQKENRTQEANSSALFFIERRTFDFEKVCK